MDFNGITVAMIALAGFFGAGVVAMWRQDHRVAAGVLAALTLVVLAVGVLSVLPEGAL